MNYKNKKNLIVIYDGVAYKGLSADSTSRKDYIRPRMYSTIERRSAGGTRKRKRRYLKKKTPKRRM